jgi:hypothetical protein
MKRLLLVLLMLGLAVSASGSVLVYTMKSSDTGMEYDWDDDAQEYMWYQWKGTYPGYMIIGPGSSGEKIGVRAVWTGKEGKQKYAYTQDWGDMNLVQAGIIAGNKTKWTWIMSDVNDEYRMLLTGDIKPKKIGSVKNKSCVSASCHSSAELAALGDIDPNIPAKLAGYTIMDEKEGDPVITYRDLFIGKMTLTLNTKMTLKAHLDGNLDAYDATYGILNDLQDAGYNIYNWP